VELRWTSKAATDLERIADYLFEQTPDHAPELVQALYEASSRLLTFPQGGRPGKKKGTRELVLSPLPYVVVYRDRRNHPGGSHSSWRSEMAVSRCLLLQSR
jgi:addiction module RelE/StbE family toxin